MITKITCRYSFEVLDFHCNDFGFTFNIGVSYLGIYKTSMISLTSYSTECGYWIRSAVIDFLKKYILYLSPRPIRLRYIYQNVIKLYYIIFYNILFLRKKLIFFFTNIVFSRNINILMF